MDIFVPPMVQHYGCSGSSRLTPSSGFGSDRIAPLSLAQKNPKIPSSKSLPRHIRPILGEYYRNARLTGGGVIASRRGQVNALEVWMSEGRPVGQSCPLGVWKRPSPSSSSISFQEGTGTS